MTNATPPPTQAEMENMIDDLISGFECEHGFDLDVNCGNEDCEARERYSLYNYIRSLQARVEVLEGEKKRMVDYLRSRSKQIQNGPYDQEARKLLSTLSE